MSYIKMSKMKFSDFTIRTKDNGAIPAHKGQTENIIRFTGCYAGLGQYPTHPQLNYAPLHSRYRYLRCLNIKKEKNELSVYEKRIKRRRWKIPSFTWVERLNLCG
jgi:hypothetical protein